MQSGSLITTHRSATRTAGFTLVELLVVIAIIGILVAMLLPSVQSARESARRMQCTNQVRQMILGVLNHHDTHGVFPSGGVDPWPRVEDYARAGKAFFAPKQGLSWAFQILPYLEEDSVHGLVSNEQLPRTPIALYFCPSRRPPTQNPGGTSGGSGRWLMDYAALSSPGARPQIDASAFGTTRASAFTFARILSEADYRDLFVDNHGCRESFLWGSRSGDGNLPNSVIGTPVAPTPGMHMAFFGVIVRSSYYVIDGTGAAGSPEVVDLRLGSPVRMSRVTDGASKTAVITEKRLPSGRYFEHKIDDDAGWSDGWDFDTIRISTCGPTPDTKPVEQNSADFAPGMTVGSAHASVFIIGFADGAVRGLGYDIDLETFNHLAHRADGDIADAASL